MLRDRELIELARREVFQQAACDGHLINEGSGSTTPNQIGDYCIRRVIAVGGMGTVYEAQHPRLPKAVALKVVRANLLSADSLRRFEFEKQILSSLNHEGIARIYDAGAFANDDGQQPFFCMELIDGRPLNRFVQDEELSPRDRVRLFVQVCEAIEHAHQKGVIHRDLKPHNILVTDERRVKVLDFGVARATDVDLKPQNIETEVGQLVGTLTYMSPDQVAGDVDQLDTRSDVYALGVVLYELLTGRLPYVVDGMRIHEITDAICNDEPQRLSPTQRRQCGDAETIVFKSLEKERERRYQSVADMRRDLQRYLSNEPIEAKQNNAWQVAAKWVKRQPAIAALITVVMVSLVAVLGATAWSYVSVQAALTETEKQRDAARIARDDERKQGRIAQRAKQTAQQKEREANKAAASERQQRERAERILFHSADTFADELMSSATQRFEAQEFDEMIELTGIAIGGLAPLVDEAPPKKIAKFQYVLAVMHAMRGSAFLEKNDLQEAQSDFQKAYELAQHLIGADPFNAAYRSLALMSLADRGAAMVREGREAEARKVFDAALAQSPAGLEALPSNPKASDEWLKMAWTKARLLCLLKRPGEAVEALAHARRLARSIVKQDPTCAPELFGIANMYGQAALLTENEQRDEVVTLALDTLEEAIVAGFDNVKMIEDSQDLALLRSHPRYQRLLDELGKK